VLGCATFQIVTLRAKSTAWKEMPLNYTSLYVALLPDAAARCRLLTDCIAAFTARDRPEKFMST
jgi:hypothetical protein